MSESTTETSLAAHPSLFEPAVIVTGGTSQVNIQACRTAISAGSKVVLLNNNVKETKTTIKILKEEFGKNTEIFFIQMDITETSSVRTAANEVLAKFPRIDTLICNATITTTSKQETAFATFESQLSDQHQGYLLLSAMLFDRIQETQGQIVIVANLGANAD